MPGDARRRAPATLRNRGPILDVLRAALPAEGLVLEVASGTGEHVAHFAATLGPELTWQPTDLDAEARASTDAWVAHARLHNVRPAIGLDAAADGWPVQRADAVIAINMVHIAPWAATVGLVGGAARILPAGDLLYLYGPFRRDGRHTAPSNAAFDEGLRRQDPAWGVRDLETVAALAAAAGFGEPAIIAMPANNLSLLFRRRAA